MRHKILEYDFLEFCSLERGYRGLEEFCSVEEDPVEHLRNSLQARKQYNTKYIQFIKKFCSGRGAIEELFLDLHKTLQMLYNNSYPVQNWSCHITLYASIQD